MAQYDVSKVYLPEVALKAALLGAVLSVSAVAIVAGGCFQLALYGVSIAVFHFSEFLCTAVYNTSQVDSDSFILNDTDILVVYAASVAEFVAHSYLLWPTPRWLVGGGLLLIAVGQGFRSVAICTAGELFNHYIQKQRKEQHKLVTSGIYRVLRHPLYFGFFWLVLGQQLVLGNAIMVFACSYKLWQFFHARVCYEEKLLVGFFGREYEEYRARTGVWIPFV